MVQSSEPSDSFLQGLEEGGSVAAIHLYVVELEGDGKAGTEPVAAVLASHDHGVAE